MKWLSCSSSTKAEVGLGLTTDGIQFYAFANLDKTPLHKHSYAQIKQEYCQVKGNKTILSFVASQGAQQI